MDTEVYLGADTMREDVEIEIKEAGKTGHLEVVKSANGILIKELNDYGHEHGRVFIYWEELCTLINELEEEAMSKGGRL